MSRLDLLLFHLGAAGPGATNASRIEPLVQTAFNKDNGVISPDRRWLAYDSNESSRNEVTSDRSRR